MTVPVDNGQALPEGLQGRAQQSAQPSNIPSQQVPQQPQEPAPQPAPPQDPYQSPMLSEQSRQAPQPPTQHLQGQQAPAEPEPKPEPTPEPTGSIDGMSDLVGDLTQDPYAKPAITYIENVCTGADVDLDRAFERAIEYGDAGLIDSAYLQEKLGKDADAVIRQASALFEYSTNKAEESLNSVYDAVGGEEVLRQAVPYFNEAAPADERAEIKYLLDSGNKELMSRAAKRIVEYSKQAGMQYSPGPQPLGNPGAAQGISREQYIEAISAKNLSQDKYEELREQRKLGAQQGL